LGADGLVRRRVVAAGRNRDVLDGLADAGADAVIRVGPHDELVTAIADAGPFDLVVDYLWGAPAEAALAALGLAAAAHAGRAPDRTRYISAGMSAGETLTLSAMSLRTAPVQIVGGGRLRRTASARRLGGDRLRRPGAAVVRGRADVDPGRQHTAHRVRPLTKLRAPGSRPRTAPPGRAAAPRIMRRG